VGILSFVKKVMWAMNSVEDSIAVKLKLSELQKTEKITAVLEFANSILSGATRSSPVELTGLFKLLLSFQSDDPQRSIQTYFKTHEMVLKVFFRENSQRFDRFEFKDLLLQLKDEKLEDHFTIPYEAKRNFEQMKPLDIRPYAEMLEANPLELQMRRNQTKNMTFDELQKTKQQYAAELTGRLNALRQEITALIGKGQPEDLIRSSIRQAAEQTIPALQMKYNNEAITALEDLLLRGTGEGYEVFQSLSMPRILCERFCDLVHKQVAVA
jgi:hypothetical protein